MNSEEFLNWLKKKAGQEEGALAHAPNKKNKRVRTIKNAGVLPSLSSTGESNANRET